MSARVAAVVVAAVATLGGACADAPHVHGGDADGDADGDAFGDAACPGPGAGLTLEETAPFAATTGPARDSGDGAVVVMGGGVEVDRAAARFVDGAGGGDVLVLRATGSTSSYTDYFSGVSGELAGHITVPAHATATIRVDDPAAGADDAVLCRLRRADAVWLAGGDQADYLVAWPAALHAALADAVARGVAVGGTSAGAMSWSQFAFDARAGGVTSTTALAAPLDPVVSVTPSPFAALPGVLIDTHFSARDREGRLLAFLARADASITGVGLDEATALVVEGDAATVRADDGGAAWLYDVAGVNVDGGALDIDRVDRSRVGDGGTIPWPPSDVTGDALAVRDGVVVAR